MENCRVKVGIFDYAVDFTNNEFYTNHIGYCSYTDKRIIIERRRTNNEVLQVLIHEVLHALWHESCLDNTPVESHSELVVDALSKQLALFIKDNPEFMHKLIYSFEGKIVE